MMEKEYSLCERAAQSAAAAVRKHALPAAASLVFGFLAHMYAFTNKLLNADETAALFSKGATLTSGRWGLEAVKLIFPDASMPWIYGVLSLVFITAAICIVIDMFRIRTKLMQILLPGAVIVFPALTGNFCFMFTSSSYAFAIFLAVLSANLFYRGGWKRMTAGCLLLAFSLGIYQAYISVAASLCVLLLIKRLMDEESTAGEVLKKGLVYLALLAASLVLYYAVTLAVEAVLGMGYQSYEVTSGKSVLHSLLMAYSSFVHIFTDGYFGYVNSGLSRLAHFICATAVLCALAANMRGREKAGKTALMLALCIAYPLSVNCIYLIASVDIIHSLVLFGFCSFYVFTAFAVESLAGRVRAVRSVTALAMALIIAGNVYFANKVYLKMYLEYENAYAFYNTLMAQVMDTPGFGEYTVIDPVGNTAGGVKRFDREIDTSGFTGPNEDLVNIYTRVSFIKYYLGLDLYMYREDTILNAPWYDEMPCYPADGSIIYRADEDRIIVKLG